MTDNSFARARSLGILVNSPVVRRDFVGQRDRLDYYRFVLNRSSAVNLNITGLRSNADLVVFDNRGRQIIRASKRGKQSEQIRTNLVAGNYYLQVLSRGGRGTNYRLAAAAVATPAPPPPPPEGSINNPINLGVLAGGTLTRSQDVASSSSPKYYRFQLAQISNVNLTLSRVSQTADIDLFYDFNGNGFPDQGESFETGRGSASTSNPISEALPTTGTYFVKVTGSFSNPGGTAYDLIVGTTPIPGNIPVDPGNDASTAYNLGSLSPGGRFEIREYAGKVDGLDFYRFNVTANTTMSFNPLSVSEGRLTAILYRDRNNNGLTDDGERITSLSQGEQVALESGATYYLSLDPSFDRNIAYTVVLSA